MKVLVDGDVIVYRAGFGADKEGPDTPLSYSLHNVKMMITSFYKYVEQYCKVESVDVFLTSADKSNFRFDRASIKPYKGNRKKSHKPQYYDEIRDYLVDQYQATIVSDQEADDEMGIRCSENPEKSLIISADKDMRMIPGWHWEMDTTQRIFYVTDPGYLTLEKRGGGKAKLLGTGYKWFAAQCLMGDVVDNIPGVKSYGDVKTYKALDPARNESEALDIVTEVYHNNGYTDKDLHEIMDLLWIRRERT